MNKAFASLAVVALSAGLASCSGGGNATPTTTAQAIPQAIATPSLSASTQVVYAALGDSITASDPANPADAIYYPEVTAKAIGASSLIDLGIPGEFSGPVNFSDVNGTAIVYPGVLAAEVQSIPTNSTIVTLYIGTNDLYFLSNVGLLPDFSNAMTVAQGVATQYAANITAIVAGIKARVPAARIIVADVPNPGWREINRSEPALALQADAFLVDSFKNTLIATGLPVVDLLCEPALYVDANYGGPYNPHPTAAGHAAMAADFIAQIQHPTAPGHCQYESP